MKAINKSIIVIISLFFISCSTEDNDIEVAKENPIEESVDILDLVKWQKIADTPVPNFQAHIVHENKLFSLSIKDTYVFDFELAQWTLLATDSDSVFPNYGLGGLKVNFIRNEKWNMFTEKGLYEFDFQLNKWSVIKEFPQVNGLFSISGFYVEEDIAIYFLDKSNGNDTIYKYDLLTNELLSHSNYINTGDRGETYNGSLKVENSYYYITPGSGTGRSNEILISKFNEDFTTLVPVGNFVTENDMANSVAVQYGNYIIFGLGGTATLDSSTGIITDIRPTLKFYAYDTVNDVFTEMSSPFYESCWAANVIVHNNEYYLINGHTIKNQKVELRTKIEKIEFNFITQ